MDRPVRIEAWVEGFVQGVSFRYHARRKAIQLNLHGFVRNLSDGRVHTLFEGKHDDAREFIKWLQTGPSMASVRNLETKELEFLGNYTTFEISF